MSSPTRSVAIIGAGPAGLVAAKTLLSHGSALFRVTVFEQHDRAGGMWAVEPEGHAQSPKTAQPVGSWQAKCASQMRTNLSRFTVAFSDLGWDWIDSVASPPPMFPVAWQVGRYTEAYARAYVPESVFRLRSRVEEVRRVDVDTEVPRWRLRWKSLTAPDVPWEETFDHILVASGFFSSPKPFELPEVPKEAAGAACVHSSRVGELAELLPSPAPPRGNIVVIGGSMSGVEAAAGIAMRLSDCAWSPAVGSLPPNAYTVTHVTNRPAYVLPRYIPHPLTTRAAFVPVDLALYDLGRRPAGPVNFALGLLSPERAEQTHKYLSEVIGGDSLANGSEELRHTDADKRDAAYVAISDSYNAFVREGLIRPLRGTVVGVNEVNTDTSVTVQRFVGDGQAETISIPDVVAVVYATGFTARPSVSYLPQTVREQLDADWSCERIPFMLHDTISHPSNSSLAFVGFYDGPFWGVMEMQARLIADRWADLAMSFTDNAADATARIDSGRERKDSSGMDAIAELQALWSMRAAMKRGDKSVPQYTLGDYVGLLEKFASTLGIERVKIDKTDEERSGPVVPARYHTGDVADFALQEISNTLNDLAVTISQATKSSRFIAAAAFTALAGPWMLRRTLASRLPDFPSGDFVGTASFHPRLPTDSAFDHEYLYIEDGKLRTTSGFEMQASRRYVYRYSAARDELSAWFVKDDGKTVDYLFHNVEFVSPSLGKPEMTGDQQKSSAVAARAFHHCSPDDYTARYKFMFVGSALEGFNIGYDVKGPRKDYVTESSYARQ